jgi:osmotically-inducible protein OsmY
VLEEELMKLSVIGLLAVLAIGPAATSAFAQTSPPAATTTAQDKTLSDLIARKIAGDPALKADAVKVTVDNGVVTLSGMVATDADRARAERLANVAGVTKIENKIVTRGDTKSKVKGTAGTVGEKTKEGAEKTKEGAKKVGEKTKEGGEKAVDKTKEGLSKTGEVITDGWITSRIKTKFMADEAIRASDINVDTNDHVVTLTGTVVSAAAHAKAIADAKEVEGVHRVIDRLKIVPKD